MSVILALELGLRLAGMKYEASFYTLEPERAYALRPYAKGWEVDENENYVRINSDGMYDKEHVILRPPNVIRIAVIGSSEAEAHSVALEKTFESVMERQLSVAVAKSGYRVEVLNFGVPGYHLSQMYLTLRDHVWKYDPQIVILASSSFAILRNTRQLYQEYGIPLYELENGRLVPDRETRSAPPPNPTKLKWRARFSNLMNESRVLLMLNEALGDAPAIADRVKEKIRFMRSPAQPHAEGHANVYAKLAYDPNVSLMRQSWAIADAFFKLMKQACDQHGAEFWIVTIEESGAVHPSLAARRVLQERLRLHSLLESDLYIEQLAHADGIPVITLAPAMGDYALRHQIALHGFFNTAFNDGHLNETGHEVAGSIIAQSLLQRSVVLQRAAPDSGGNLIEKAASSQSH